MLEIKKAKAETKLIKARILYKIQENIGISKLEEKYIKKWIECAKIDKSKEYFIEI